MHKLRVAKQFYTFLMIDLEEIFGLKVDVIHEPKKDSWMIEIDKEIEIYAA